MRLAKYEALGNDFLVLVDPERRGPFGPEGARRLCDRRHGVGADGLLRLSHPAAAGGDFEMELLNADGSAAETSGNGLRCAVLAALDAGMLDGRRAPTVAEIATGAGVVRAEIAAGATGAGGEVRVDMGELALEAAPSPLADRLAYVVDAGNPHLVLLAREGDEVAPVDLAELGPRLERRRPGGTNVELVTAGPGVSRCSLAVWERGAGLTLACGSGSCAAAAAARAAGLAGDEIEVANPGGVLAVSLRGPVDRPRAILAGPARRVATVEVDW